MTSPIDWNSLTPTREMTGQDPSDTKSLWEMLERAEAYVKSFHWAPPVVETFLGLGVGGVVAVFLFRFAMKIKGTDDLLWVVEGDVPSAYLVTDNAPDPESALSGYCDLMEAWARAVLSSTPLDEVFPVAAPPTAEWANSLLSRIRFIREKIIPSHRAG